MLFQHIPVLLKEAIEFLNVKKDKKYIDATLGGGGYTFEILRKGGIVLGVDKDRDAIESVKLKIKNEKLKIRIGEELTLISGNFGNIKEIAHLNNFDKVSGIVFDLGLSSNQIEKSGRGFSFLRNEPLDMRMSVTAEAGQLTASEIVNSWSKEELYELFSKMGEERFALAISNNIVGARRVKPIKDTLELVKIVTESIPERRGIHPATKVFQALRIAVNDEIRNLRLGLKEGFDILDEGGRLIVVSFHSLEDRLIKSYFNFLDKEKFGKILTKKPILSSEEEINKNIRARSGKLRCVEKVTA